MSVGHPRHRDKNATHISTVVLTTEDHGKREGLKQLTGSSCKEGTGIRSHHAPGWRPQAHRPGRPPAPPDREGQHRAQQPGLSCLSPGRPVCDSEVPVSQGGISRARHGAWLLAGLRVGWWVLLNGIANWHRAGGSERVHLFVFCLFFVHIFIEL